MEGLKEIYNKSKNTKVEENCVCPSCGSKFNKTNYQQAFCKNKRGTICKDKYWNTVIPEKRNNTTRISPASAAWTAKNDIPVIEGYGNSQRQLDKEDMLSIEQEDDGSWDSHQAPISRCEWCECLICRCDNY